MNLKNLFAALLLTIGLTAFTAPAQTATNTLTTTFLHALSLRNPAIQQTNTISVEIGEGVRTEPDSTLQATTLRGFYLIDPKVQVGLRAELDTLGEADTIAGVSVGLEARYLSDNLFAAAVIGYHRDIEDDTRAAEFGIGLGAFITPNFAVNTELLMQYHGDDLTRAIVISASYRF